MRICILISGLKGSIKHCKEISFIGFFFYSEKKSESVVTMASRLDVAGTSNAARKKNADSNVRKKSGTKCLIKGS